MEDDLLFHRMAWRIAERMPRPPRSRAAQARAGQNGAGQGRALLITSVRPGEGRSFIAAALAAAFGSQIPGPVALVECGGAAAGAGGLASGVGGGAAAGGAVVHSGAVAAAGGARTGATTWNLLVATGAMDPRGAAPAPGLPVSRIPYGDADSAVIFRAEGVSRAMASLRSHFAFVVLDGPVLSDCGVLSAFSDGCLLVINANRTRREIVKGALQGSPIDSQKMLGAVLNERPQYVPSWLYRRAL